HDGSMILGRQQAVAGAARRADRAITSAPAARVVIPTVTHPVVLAPWKTGNTSARGTTANAAATVAAHRREARRRTRWSSPFPTTATPSALPNPRVVDCSPPARPALQPSRDERDQVVVAFFGLFALFYVNASVLQYGRGFSALAGLGILPLTLPMLLVGRHVPRLAARIGP